MMVEVDRRGVFVIASGLYTPEQAQALALELWAGAELVRKEREDAQAELQRD